MSDDQPQGEAYEWHDPDHWTAEGKPQETLHGGDGVDELDEDQGLVEIRSDDATTEFVHYKDGSVVERDRTVIDDDDVPDLEDPAQMGECDIDPDELGPLGAGGWTWVSTTGLPRKPLWTPQQAVAQARLQVTRDTCPHYNGYGGLCLHFTACMYGFGSSGTYDAASFWRLMPNKYCHYEDRTPPVGSLVCWYGGSSGHGHIAVVVADNATIASNDIRRYQHIDLVPLSEISSRWGQDYKGWTPPYYARGNGTNGQTPQIGAGDASTPESESREWAKGDVYVAKLHMNQHNSDSVKRLKYRLINHGDVPQRLKKGIKFNGDYEGGLRAAVEWWQHQIPHDAAARDRDFLDGRELSFAQAERLFGKRYDVYQSVNARKR